MDEILELWEKKKKRKKSEKREGCITLNKPAVCYFSHISFKCTWKKHLKPLIAHRAFSRIKTAFLETTDEDGGNFSVKWHRKHHLVMVLWWTTVGGWGLHTLWPLVVNVISFLEPSQQWQGLTQLKHLLLLHYHHHHHSHYWHDHKHRHVVNNWRRVVISAL